AGQRDDGRPVRLAVIDTVQHRLDAVAQTGQDSLNGAHELVPRHGASSFSDSTESRHPELGMARCLVDLQVPVTAGTLDPDRVHDASGSPRGHPLDGRNTLGRLRAPSRSRRPLDDLLLLLRLHPLGFAPLLEPHRGPFGALGLSPFADPFGGSTTFLGAGPLGLLPTPGGFLPMPGGLLLGRLFAVVQHPLLLAVVQHPALLVSAFLLRGLSPDRRPRRRHQAVISSVTWNSTTFHERTLPLNLRGISRLIRTSFFDCADCQTTAGSPQFGSDRNRALMPSMMMSNGSAHAASSTGVN